MTRFVQIVWLQALLTVVAPWALAEEKNVEQDEAVAAITRMKGRVEFDAKRPGKPVVKIHLFGGKTAGIGLAPLARLPDTEWIGLHLSDITEDDLEHLKGLKKLRRLGLADIKLTDAGVKRLEDMSQLEILYLMENPITDAGLDHLRKMTKLKELGLGQTKITDAGLAKLKVFQDLEYLGLQQLPVTDAGTEHLKTLPRLQNLDLGGCGQVQDLQPLHGLPLTTLNLMYLRKLKTLEPLSGMPLSTLNLFACAQIRDLSPLAKAPLTNLDLGGTQAADLSPLRGMKLTTLNCSQTPVSDLSPLEGMPLTSLRLLQCEQLHDLAPLARMNLSEISLTPANLTTESLETLRPMKSLKTIVVGPKPTERLAPQDFWKKVDAGEFKK